MDHYVSYADLAAVIPADFLTQALDDNRDGTPESWPVVQAAACRAVDAALGVRFAVPFSHPAPAIVREASFLFAAETCYLRRGVSGKENPFAERAADTRKTLAQIAAGELPLDPHIGREKPSVSLITEPSRTAGDRLSI
jgi:phage gp36-like protein